MIRRGGVFLSLLAGLLLTPFVAHAQATGTISGRVSNATGQPLAETRIQVVGTTRGAMTDASGNYRIQAVPAGAQEVRALRLGY